MLQNKLKARSEMMKRLICFLLAAVMLLALAACGEEAKETAGTTTQATTLPPETTEPPLTAKQVVQQMTAAVQGKTMTGSKTRMDIEIAISMPSQELEMTMKMALDMTMKMEQEPLTAFMDMQITMEVMGQTINMNTQNYIVTEDGQIVSYVYLSQNGSWTRVPMPLEDSEALTQQANYDWLLKKAEEDFVLEKQTQTVAGREVYVLKCTLTGEEMQETMKSTAGLSDSLANMGMNPEDFSALNVPTVYYIDTQTFLPVQQVLQMEGMEELMSSVLKSSLGAAADTSDLKTEMEPIELVMTDITYDPVEVPVVPEEAYAAIAATGTYLLKDGQAAVQVVCPQGWTEDETQVDALSITKADETQAALYIAFADVTGMDFPAIIEQGDVKDLKDMGLYSAHGKGESLGGYATMWIQGKGVNIYYAWGPVGDAYVYAHVIDYAGQTMEEALTPLLNAISAPRAE